MDKPGLLTNTFRFLSPLFPAMVMAAALAPLFELPHKINLPGRNTSQLSGSTG